MQTWKISGENIVYSKFCSQQIANVFKIIEKKKNTPMRIDCTEQVTHGSCELAITECFLEG